MKKLTKLIGLLGLLVMVSCGKNASINTAKVEECLNGGIECETLVETPKVWLTAERMDLFEVPSITVNGQEFTRFWHDKEQTLFKLITPVNQWDRSVKYLKFVETDGELTISFVTKLETIIFGTWTTNDQATVRHDFTAVEISGSEFRVTGMKNDNNEEVTTMTLN